VENRTSRGGGLLCLYGGAPAISNCTILRNVVTGPGGGLFCGYVEATISNCTIAENTAGEGGGLSSVGSSATLTNCTLAANSASVGGAVHNSDGSATLTNCILWNDLPNEIHSVPGDVVVTYSDVQGGWAGEGNIDADPLFVGGFLGDYYLSQTAAGQPVDSPCVDAGSDTAENLGLDTRTTRTDQVGDAGIVDMGYHYPIVCVGDLDGDNDTDQADLGILLADWGCDDPVNGCAGDLNGDDRTDQADLGILLGDWGCTN